MSDSTRSSRRRSRSSGSWLARIMIAGVILVIAGVAGVMWGVMTFRKYLTSDALRLELASRLSSRLGDAEVEMAPLSWNGGLVRVDRLGVVKDDLVNGQVHGLQATLDWAGLKWQTVHVTEFRADSVELEFAGIAPTGEDRSDKGHEPDVNQIALPETPAGWRAWLPNKAEVDRVIIDRVDATQTAGSNPIRLRDARIVAEPAAGEKAWSIQMDESELAIGTSEQGSFDVRSASLRADESRLFVNDVRAGWMGGSEVTGRGFLEFGSGQLDFGGRVTALDVLKLIGPSWKGKLSGDVNGEFHLGLSAGQPMRVKGHAALKGGVLQQMAVLERIATYTKVDRFRRLVLDIAEADYVWTPGSVTLKNLVIQSDGLIRIQGGIAMHDGALSGTLQVGVTSGTLRWIPGAERRVFVELAPSASSPSGYVWTTVRLGGTTSAPTEDLSDRLMAGVGTELLLAPVETATKVLEGATGAKLPKAGEEVLKGGTDTLKKGLEAGAGLLKGFLPGN